MKLNTVAGHPWKTEAVALPPLLDPRRAEGCG